MSISATTVISIKPTLVKPYPLEVVGESRYKSNLLQICGDYDTSEGYEDDGHAAELILEDNNPYDPGNAVLVQIDDLPVGYLSKSDARLYRQRLQTLGFSGNVVAVSTASIKGGFEHGGEIADFGVRLAFFASAFETESKKQIAAVAQKNAPAKKQSSNTCGVIVLWLLLFPILLPAKIIELIFKSTKDPWLRLAGVLVVAGAALIFFWYVMRQP